MTLGTVLDTLQSLRPHEFPESLLRAWLREVEEMIYLEIIEPRTPGAQAPRPIGEETDYTCELQAPEPYHQLYLFYLMTRMDLQRAESERYAFDGAMFHQAYLEFAHAYARKHLPISDGRVSA